MKIGITASTTNLQTQADPENRIGFFYTRWGKGAFFFDSWTKKKAKQKRNLFRAAFEGKASKTPRTVTQNSQQS